MRRGLALARDYATRRHAFGGPLSEKPLHLDTLATLQAEYEAAFHLTFFVVELLGRVEAQQASERQHELFRILTPMAKLVTGRQVVAVLAEVVEAFGGAGYVEDTGVPALLRDAQVLPIWEGTTNVLSLDLLRALAGTKGLTTLRQEAHYVLRDIRHPDLLRLSALVESVLERSEASVSSAMDGDVAALEAGARRLAITLGRTLSLALLARHAQWSLDHEHDARALAAARRFAAAGVNFLADLDAVDARMLARDEP